jgi:ABC-type Fe3+-hydroxamate transport system substrate-binding protein
MPVFFDQLNREVNLPRSPIRIISTVPSQTELLFYLGLDKYIVGITNFCTRPADKVKTITKIGGTKKLNIKLIKELRPDLIIANKEENEREQIEELTAFCPVWISDVDDLPTAIDMIQSIGQMLRRKNKADALNRAIQYRFRQLHVPATKLRVAYLIWRKPYMVAGNGTYINNMLQLCGFINVFDVPRYPEVNNEQLIAANADVILLSSEPYPFSEKHVAEFSALLPKARISVVDGEMFSWYGSRLLGVPGYLAAVVESIVNRS